jgi:hypothetical protein
MDGKTKMVLGALLFFGSASSVFAGTNLGNDHGLVAPRRRCPSPCPLTAPGPYIRH